MTHKLWKKILIWNLATAAINASWYLIISLITMNGWGSNNNSDHVVKWIIEVLFPILIGCGFLIIFNLTTATVTVNSIKNLFNFKHKFVKNSTLFFLILVTWFNIFTLNIINISILIYLKLKNRIEKPEAIPNLKV